VHLPGQHTIFDKSHSGWSGAPRHVYPEITPGVSSTPVKDGGLFFVDAGRGRGCLLHHRHDGGYGLVEPAGAVVPD
jgi:hypothetical protein